MVDYGDVKVGYHHVTPGGVESLAEHKVDANTANMVTTTLGVNLDSGNDFTIPVQMTNGQTIHLRPDTAEELKNAARMAVQLRQQGEEFGTITVYNNDGSKRGEIDPQALLSALP